MNNELVLNNSILILSVLLLLNLVSLGFLTFLYLKLKKFTKGKDAGSLEDAIQKIIEENQTILNENQELKKLALDLLNRDKNNLKSVSVVKFNPFSQTGHGKQSFATAILSEKGDGLVLSTLSVRGETHVFIKEVKHFNADALTDEEKQAIEQAKHTLQNNLNAKS